MSNENVLPVKFGGSTFPQETLYKGFSEARDYLVNMHVKGYNTIGVVSAIKGMSDMVIEGQSYLNDPDFMPRIPLVKKAADASGRDRKKFAKELTGGMMDIYSTAIQSSEHPESLRNDIEAELERLRISLEEKGNEHVVKALPENHSGIFLSHALKNAGFKTRYMDGMQAGIKAGPRGMVKRAVSSLEIRKALRDYIGKGKIPVVGGYIGSRIDSNEPIILGRNSTDVTCAIIGLALGAHECQIIKDVPGVYRVEPEIEVNGEKIEIVTKPLVHASYDESIQLAFRGASVVHPCAIDIAREGKIPIRIKTLGSEDGTIISEQSDTTPENPIAAMSTGVFYLLSVNDPAMSVPEESKGYMHLVTGILSDMDVSFADCATPASVMTFAIPSKYEKKLIDIGSIKKNLESCLREYGCEPRNVGYRGVGGISLTGDAMRGTPGVTTRISKILADRRISIAMGGQSDEREGSPAINYYVELKDFEHAIRGFCKELF